MRLIFVSDRKDAHVKRFSNLFRSLTKNYIEVVYSRESGKFVGSSPDLDCANWGSLRSKIEEEPSVVVSGPLDSVSQHLKGGDYRHVGISWATDVMVSARHSWDALTQLSETVRLLDYVLTDNYATENVLISLGTQPESVLRFPWGPGEPVLGNQAHKRSDFGLPEGKTLILSLRNMEPHYEPETVLQAFAALSSKIPEAQLVLVRRGSGISSAEDLIGSLGLSEKVTWVETLEPGQFNSLIASVNVVVSSAKTDGTAVSVLEAMAQGIPVVATLTNGSAEWLVDGITGWTYAPGQEAALETKLSQVLSMDIGHKKAIVTNAQKLVASRAGWAQTSNALSETLSRLLRGT